MKKGLAKWKVMFWMMWNMVLSLWRCPYGKGQCSKCKNSCTGSKYGRGIKTRPDWDIRLYTNVPRGTDAYKKIYKQHTVSCP